MSPSFHRFTYPSSTATIYVFAQCVCNMRAVLSSGQKRRGFALRPTGCFRLGAAGHTDCVNNPPLNRFSLNKEDLCGHRFVFDPSCQMRSTHELFVKLACGGVGGFIGSAPRLPPHSDGATCYGSLCT